MIICVCRYQRRPDGGMKHLANRMLVSGNHSVTYDGGIETLQCDLGEFRRPAMAFSFASEHGWEKVHD